VWHVVLLAAVLTLAYYIIPDRSRVMHHQPGQPYSRGS
jgi:hypothetical protein